MKVGTLESSALARDVRACVKQLLETSCKDKREAEAQFRIV